MSRWPLALLLVAGAASAEPDGVARAQELLRRANHEHDPDARYRLADQARELAEQASLAQPKSGAPLLEMARALAISDPNHPEQCRPPVKETCERAVELLKKARAVDVKQVEAEHIAFELGIVYSRLGHFKEALAEYETARTLWPSEREANGWDDESVSRSILFSNSAETLMALGRIQDAIGRYRVARDMVRPFLPTESAALAWELAEWGLGVALDRDDQLEAARASVASALERDPNMMHLRADDVFFEPAGEQFYYLALGHEVAGDRDEAIAAWQKYLASSDARYSRRAKAHLESLRRGAGGGPLDRLKVSAPTVEVWGQGRPKEEVRAQLVRDKLIDMRRCYARSLRDRPSLKGNVGLSLEIYPAGFVHQVHVMDDVIPDEKMMRCVRRTAETWRFGSIENGGVVSLFLRFSFDGQK
jgi:tetratricopeptide (TPR) repeat protein